MAAAQFEEEYISKVTESKEEDKLDTPEFEETNSNDSITKSTAESSSKPSDKESPEFR